MGPGSPEAPLTNNQVSLPSALCGDNEEGAESTKAKPSKQPRNWGTVHCPPRPSAASGTRRQGQAESEVSRQSHTEDTYEGTKGTSGHQEADSKLLGMGATKTFTPYTRVCGDR